MQNAVPLTTPQPAPPVTLNRIDEQHFVIKIQRISRDIEISQVTITISIVDHTDNDVLIRNGVLSGTLYNDYIDLRGANNPGPSSFFTSSSDPLEIIFNTNTSVPTINMVDFNNDGYMWIHLKLKVGAANGLANETVLGSNYKIKIKDSVVTSSPIEPTCEREFLITHSS